MKEFQPVTTSEAITEQLKIKKIKIIDSSYFISREKEGVRGYGGGGGGGEINPPPGFIYHTLWFIIYYIFCAF